MPKLVYMSVCPVTEILVLFTVLNITDFIQYTIRKGIWTLQNFMIINMYQSMIDVNQCIISKQIYPGTAVTVLNPRQTLRSAMDLSWGFSVFCIFSLISLFQGFGGGGGGKTMLSMRQGNPDTYNVLCIAAELMHTYIKLHSETVAVADSHWLKDTTAGGKCNYDY